MAHEKDSYDMEKIPDYAMQPAREDIDTFDPTVYEKLFSELAPLEQGDAEFREEGAPDEMAALLSRLVEQEKEQSAAAAQAGAVLDEVETVGPDFPAEEPKEESEAAFEMMSEAPEEFTTEAQAPADTQTDAPADTGAMGAKPEADHTQTESAETLERTKSAEAAPAAACTPASAAAAATAESEEPAAAKEEDIAHTVEVWKNLDTAETADSETVETAAPEAQPADAAEDVEEEQKTQETAAEISEEMQEAEPAAAPAAEEAEEESGGIEPVAPSTPASAPAAKIIPAGSSVISNNLKLTDIRSVPKLRLFIEEDILVPDVKPDLASVLSMEAEVRLSERETPVGAQGADSIKLTGDLMVSTLYLPDKQGEGETIVAIESRIPFKQESDIKAEPYSELSAAAAVESIDFTVINERKFKVKATVAIDLREYRSLNLELFEGLRDEEVQMLSETIHLTDVAMRKTESMELSEELPLKDGSGSIGKILCYDVNVVENHKQITGEKAVINGTAYVNAMYQAEETGEFNPEEGTEAVSAEPMLFQGKVEFTQFIKLDDDGPTERPAQNPVGSKVSFRVAKAELTPSQSNEENESGFALNLDIETTLELYKDLETDVVTDVYHHLKEMRYDTREVSVMDLCGSGVAEVSAREIINVPEKYGSVDRVVFITGRISDVRAGLEAGKSVTEGVVSLSMICIAANEERTPFSMKKEIPFRSAIDIPGVKSGMEADSEALLKELWYDKINNRQIEVNAGVLVNATVCSRQKHPLINNVSFVEMPESSGNEPSIILYITRDGDNVWRIAKKYRTTIENIKKINGIDDSGKLKPGTKLLIVK